MQRIPSRTVMSARNIILTTVVLPVSMAIKAAGKNIVATDFSNNTVAPSSVIDRQAAVVTTRKFSASEMETLMDKVKKFQDRKRSISPKMY